MDYEKRKSLYKELEQERDSYLFVYSTSFRQNLSAGMAYDAIPIFIRQMERVPKDAKKADILIASNGGDPMVAWRIISLLRDRFEEVSALIPYSAFSAATLLALGANEILMHPFSNLGPVDPQITSQEKAGTVLFGAEDLKHYFEFVKKDLGLTDQEHISVALQKVHDKISPTSIGTAKRSVSLLLSMVDKMLGMHIKDSNKVRAISEALHTSFYSHSHPIGRQEATDIGLPVKKPSEKIEKLMWEIWRSISDEMKCEVPFNDMEIVLSNEEVARLLLPVPQLNMPKDLPLEVQQQILNAYLQTHPPVMVPPTPFSEKVAFIETRNLSACCCFKGKIQAVRMEDLNIRLSRLASAAWEC